MFSCLLFKSQLPGTGIILNCKTCQDASRTWVGGATSMLVISREVSEAHCHHLATHSAIGKERRKAAQKLQHLKGKRVCFKTNKQTNRFSEPTQITTLGHNFARDSCYIPLVLSKVDSYQYYLSASQNYRSLKSTSFS